MKDKGKSIMLIWVLIGAVFVSLPVLNQDIIPTVEAAIIIVPNDYPTIQEAIDAASPGDTVYVTSGVYNEDIVIDKQITLMGEDKSNTLLDGGVFGETVHVDADWVNITGFSIEYGGGHPGESAIELDHVNNCSIINNNIDFNNYFGIFLNGSNDNEIRSNLFLHNRYGLWLESSENNLIEANIFNNDSVVITGNEPSHFNSHFITVNNIVNGGPLYYYNGYSGQTLNGNFDNFGQIILVECQDIVLTNLTLGYSDVSIEIAYSSSISLTNSYIHDIIYYGLYVYLSTEVDISNNTFDTYKEGGINIQGSSSIILSGNELTSTITGAEKLTEGLLIEGSSDMLIRNNYFSNTEIGVLVESTDNLDFFGNTFENDGIIIKGGQLSHFNSHSIPTNNTVNGKPLYYHKNENDIAIDGIPAGELIIVNSTNFTVANLVLYNSDMGIEVAYSNNIFLSLNTIYSQYVYGLYLYSAEVDLIDNDIYSSNYGVFIESSSLCNINFNNISDNSKGMKLLESSNYNNIIGNDIISNNNEGIILYSSFTNLISNNNISENYWGIYLVDSNENQVISNGLFDNRYAIFNKNSFDSTIQGNTLNAMYHGVWLVGSQNVKVYSNTFSKVGVFIEGEEVSHFNTHTITTNNTVNGKPIYYHKDEEGLVIDGIPVGELILANCTDFNVTDLIIDNVDVAFEMAYSSSGNISALDISETMYGMWSWSVKGNHFWDSSVMRSDIGMSFYSVSHNNNLSNINVSDNQLWGILLSDSSFNTVRDGFAYSNMNGIKLIGSDNNTVTKNTFGGFGTAVVLDRSSNHNHISNNYAQGLLRGIFVSGSSHNTMKFNVISENSMDGIVLTDGSSYNVIIGNYLSDNGRGISMDNAEMNLIYHNNLYFNVEQAYDSTGNNLWNDSYPSGGNYWTDYSGNDLLSGPSQTIPGSDGIGDTPYSIPDLGQDKYPLMGPFLPDIEPPLIDLIAPTNNSVIGSNSILDFDISDDNLNEVTYSVNGNPQGTFDTPYDIDTSGWSDGVYLIDIYASDTQGNDVSKWFNFTVDSTLPEIVLNSPANNSYVIAGPDLDFFVSDTYLYEVNHSINGNPSSPLLDPFDIPTAGWADGDYNIQIDAKDLAGNIISRWFHFIFDSTEPRIILNSPANNSFVVGGTILDLWIDEPNLDQASYNIDGGPWNPFASPFDIPTTGIDDGDFTVTVQSIDHLGLSNTSWFLFTLDSTLPQIILSSPANNSFISKGTLLNFEVMDSNLDQVSYTINTGSKTPFLDPYDIATTDWVDSDYTVTIEASDLAGNIHASWYLFTVDSAEPTVVLNSPQNNSFVDKGTTIDLSIGDDNLKDVTWSLNGGAHQELSDPYDISTSTFSEGLNTIQIIAKDEAGNEHIESFEFTLDSQDPEISLLSPEEDSYLIEDERIKLKITDENLDFVSYSINGGSQKSLSSPFEIDTDSWNNGDYTLTVLAVDHAGNQDESSFSFKKDLLPPTITLSAPANNSLVITGEDIDFDVFDYNLNSVEYSQDGVNYDKLDDPFVLSTSSWEDGSYIIYIRAEDEAGNSIERWFTFLVDESEPSIISTFPDDNADDISRDTDIIIEFSEAMDVDSVEDAISISPFLDYSLSWNNDKTEFTISFSEPLEGESNYKVVITTRAKDLAGRELDSKFELEFTTETIEGEIGEEPSDLQPLILSLIIIIVIVIILILLLSRRKKQDQMEVPLEVSEVKY